MNKIYIGILCLLLIAGCKKKEHDPVIPVETEHPINFGGITMTDVNGVTIYEDSTDWRVGESWAPRVAGLFAEDYDTACALTQPYNIVIYPNPCAGLFAMHLNMSATSRLAFRLVDRKYHVLLWGDSLLSSNIHISLDSISLEDTVRMYYKFIDGNCEYRGHGDILINQDL